MLWISSSNYSLIFYSQCWAEDRLYSKWLHMHQHNKGHASFSNNKLTEYRLLLHDHPGTSSQTSKYFQPLPHIILACTWPLFESNCAPWLLVFRAAPLCHEALRRLQCQRNHGACLQAVDKLITDYPTYRLFSVGSKTEVIGCWDIIWFNKTSASYFPSSSW